MDLNTAGQDTTTIELEFEGGTTRFKVSKTLWEQGLSFDNAIRLFQGLPPK